MTLFDELDTAEVTPPPKGWEPYSSQVGQVGEAIVRIPSPGSTRRDLLITAGFDPDEWTIIGDVEARKWMRSDQEWLHYYKFKVGAGVESDDQRVANVEDLVRSIRRSTRPRRRLDNGTDAWVYVASDWQIGKCESGSGSQGTVDRVVDSIDKSVIRIKELRRGGRLMPTGAFIGAGDLGEGTCGFYPGQEFMIDLNRRDQNKVTRSLITYGVDQLAPLFDEFTIAAVGGNHGENRQNGKRATNDADNDDVAQFECVREAFDRAEVEGLTWIIPEDELSLRLQLGGIGVGVTHGHLFSGGGKLSQAKALEWWRGQVFGLQAVADTKLLISAHFHHFSVICHGARTHLQTPAMDPGSRWVTNAWGNDTPAGVLTLRVDVNEPLGWSDLQVIGG